MKRGQKDIDYEALLNVVLDIGKEMVKSGAETNRAEDSIYRMMESYGTEQCNAFVIQSNIQATIKPPGKPILHRFGGYIRLGSIMTVWTI